MWLITITLHLLCSRSWGQGLGQRVGVHIWPDRTPCFSALFVLEGWGTAAHREAALTQAKASLVQCHRVATVVPSRPWQRARVREECLLTKTGSMPRELTSYSRPNEWAKVKTAKSLWASSLMALQNGCGPDLDLQSLHSLLTAANGASPLTLTGYLKLPRNLDINAGICFCVANQWLQENHQLAA